MRDVAHVIIRDQLLQFSLDHVPQILDGQRARFVLQNPDDLLVRDSWQVTPEQEVSQLPVLRFQPVMTLLIDVSYDGHLCWMSLLLQLPLQLLILCFQLTHSCL